MARTSYSGLLSKRASELCKNFSEVKTWFETITELKSPRTQNDYLEALDGFIHDTGKSPAELVRLNSKEAYELMKDWVVKKLKSKSVSSGTVHAHWYGIRSFFEHHQIMIIGECPVKRGVKTFDKIPTKEELKHIMDAAPSLQTKIAIHLIAYGGLRPEDVCDLTYGSVKDDIEKHTTPCAVYVPQSKEDNVYITFIPKQTTELLEQHFKNRKQKGEEITDSSPILKGQKSEDIKGIRRKTLTHNINQALRRSGIELTTTIGNKTKRMRPYSLRKYFRSNLVDKVPPEYLEAWMGHTAGLDQVYNGTRDLDPTTTERMREHYKKAEQHLHSDSPDIENVRQIVVKEAKLQALKVLAKDLLGWDVKDATFAKTIGLNRNLTVDEEIQFYEQELKKHREKEPVIEDLSRYQSKLVRESELEKYLNQGWQMVQVINSKILIRKLIEAPRKEEKQKAPQRPAKAKKDVKVRHSKELKKILADVSKLAQKQTISIG